MWIIQRLEHDEKGRPVGWHDTEWHNRSILIKGDGYNPQSVRSAVRFLSRLDDLFPDSNYRIKWKREGEGDAW